MNNVYFDKSEIMNSVKFANPGSEGYRSWENAFNDELRKSIQDTKDFYKQNTRIKIILDECPLGPDDYKYENGELYDCDGNIVTDKFSNMANVSKKIYNDLHYVAHMAERFANDLLGFK